MDNQNDNNYIDFDLLSKLSLKCNKCSNFPLFKIYQYNNDYDNNPFDFNNKVLIYVSCHGENHLMTLQLFIKYFNNTKEICENCLKEEISENLIYCKICQIFFCGKCNDNHISHETITYNLYKNKCKIHFNEEQKYYCLTCNKTICLICHSSFNYNNAVYHFTFNIQDIIIQNLNDLKNSLNQIELKINNTDNQAKKEIIKIYDFFTKDEKMKIKLENKLNDAYESYKQRNLVVIYLLRSLISVAEKYNNFIPFEIKKNIQHNLCNFNFNSFKISEDITKYKEVIKDLFDYYHKTICISSYYFKYYDKRNIKQKQKYNYLGFQVVKNSNKDYKIHQLTLESDFELKNLLCFINNSKYINSYNSIVYYNELPGIIISQLNLFSTISKAIILGKKKQINVIISELYRINLIYIINISDFYNPKIKYIYINPHFSKIDVIIPLFYNKQYKKTDFMTYSLFEETIKIFRAEFPFCCLRVIKINKRIINLIEIGNNNIVKNYVNEGKIIGVEKGDGNNFINLFFYDFNINDINLSRREIHIESEFSNYINFRIFDKNNMFKLMFNSKNEIRILNLANYQIESVIKFNHLSFFDFFPENEIFVTFENLFFFQYDLTTLAKISKFDIKINSVPKEIYKFNNKIIIIFCNNSTKIFSISFEKKSKKIEENCLIY